MKKDVLFMTGNEDFVTIIEKNAYYVDKTPYLKDLFMSSSEVMNALFIRPRRFGKTLNLNMIKAFCELNYQNPGDKSYQHRCRWNGCKLWCRSDQNCCLCINSWNSCKCYAQWRKRLSVKQKKILCYQGIFFFTSYNFYCNNFATSGRFHLLAIV